MDIIRIFIIILSVGTLILVIYGVNKLKWKLEKISHIITILGIIIGISVVYIFSPTLVEIEHKPKIELYSFDAITTISIGREVLVDHQHLNIPGVYYLGYISNVGNAPAYNLAFEFKWGKFAPEENLGKYFSYYLFNEPNFKIPSVISFDWNQSDFVKIEKENGTNRIYLPPLSPNKSVGLIIGLKHNFQKSFTIKELDTLINDVLELRVITYENRLSRAPEKKISKQSGKIIDATERYYLLVRNVDSAEFAE